MIEGVPADPEYLCRTGKLYSVGGSDPDGAARDPAFAPVLLHMVFGAGCGEWENRSDLAEQGGLVAFDRQGVVPATLADDVGRGGVLGMRGVPGDDYTDQIDIRQQVVDLGDLVRARRDPPLRDHDRLLMQQRRTA
ncbi:hypothetical protein [Lentzea jiangxiensis]|uniref:hypothetical protein n=1 Tax=Lentzea jiangxiensis TaxID=641025 RepID=UPI00115FF14D